jgi:D-mannonate dehydratase
VTEKTVELDQHRGMAAQKATDLRRTLAEVEANEHKLRLQQDEIEAQLVAAPAADWHEAAAKARYLINLYAAMPGAQDQRKQQLVAAVLADFRRLSEDSERVQ